MVEKHLRNILCILKSEVEKKARKCTEDVSLETLINVIKIFSCAQLLQVVNFSQFSVAFGGGSISSRSDRSPFYLTNLSTFTNLPVESPSSLSQTLNGTGIFAYIYHNN